MFFLNHCAGQLFKQPLLNVSVRMKKEHVEYFANIVWANDELSAVGASQNNIMNNAEAYLDWLLREYIDNFLRANNVTKLSKRKIEWLWKI